MVKICVEFRPRLGAATVFISDENFADQKHFSVVDENVNAILVFAGIEENPEEVCRFFWPGALGKISANQQSKSILNVEAFLDV